MLDQVLPDVNALLRKIVSESCSYAEALRKLGLVPAGGNYKTLKGHIARLQIDISHMLGKRHNRGRKLPHMVTQIDEYLSGKKSIQSYRLKHRLLKEGMLQAVCSGCGLDNWLGGPIPLELDHIDGCSNNNNFSNLRLLCPNCHALTSTYRGKNIKKAKIAESTTRIRFRNTVSNRLPTYKIEWPSDGELQKLVESYPMYTLGKMLGVSATAIKKRCVKRGIVWRSPRP